MLMSLFIIAAIVFVLYALFANYKSTPADSSVAMRIWMSVLAALASAGAAIATFFHSSSATP